MQLGDHRNTEKAGVDGFSTFFRLSRTRLWFGLLERDFGRLDAAQWSDTAGALLLHAVTAAAFAHAGSSRDRRLHASHEKQRHVLKHFGHNPELYGIPVPTTR
jgi:hypothetical protein